MLIFNENQLKINVHDNARKNWCLRQKANLNVKLMNYHIAIFAVFSSRIVPHDWNVCSILSNDQMTHFKYISTLDFLSIYTHETFQQYIQNLHITSSWAHVYLRLPNIISTCGQNEALTKLGYHIPPVISEQQWAPTPNLVLSSCWSSIS